MIPFILWAAGLLCLFSEFFIPGAIFGFAGSFLMLASIVLFAYATSSGIWLLIYGILMALSIVGVIKLALVTIRKSSKTQSFFSDEDQSGYLASSFDKTAIGKEGTVLSDLKPSGYVLIEGQKFQARSISGYIVADSKIEVIAGEEDSLVVKLIAIKGE